MSSTQLTDILVDICILQANVIREQAFALSQFGVAVCEDEAELARRKLNDICGDR